VIVISLYSIPPFNQIADFAFGILKISSPVFAS
jgi:hypothetical protein